MYQLLSEPWQELWLSWLDEGDTAHRQQAAEGKQARLAFVQRLVASAAMGSAQHTVAAASDRSVDRSDGRQAETAGSLSEDEQQAAAAATQQVCLI